MGCRLDRIAVGHRQHRTARRLRGRARGFRRRRVGAGLLVGLHRQPRCGGVVVRRGIAVGVGRADACVAGGRLPAVARPRRRDTAPRCLRRRGSAVGARRRARRRGDRLGVLRRRGARPAAGAARRVPTARRTADRRRGARPRRAGQRRTRAAARGRPGRCARRGDDDDAVQGAGQPGRCGARTRPRCVLI